jgi:hypothetical protein
MKRMILVAAALAACGLGTAAFAQAPAGEKAADKAAELKAFQARLQRWPFVNYPGREMPNYLAGYHPDYKEYCKTCYGGGGCGKDDTCWRCGACSGDICERKKIQTCHKCGVVGRVLFYECKRLGCGEVGGSGCDRGCPMTICNSRGERKIRPAGFARYLTGEGESVFWLGGGPNYIPRFNCYGWGKNNEGPRGWYGTCCGCYETYLAGPYDSRGPLNLDPSSTSRCREEDAIPSDFQNIRTKASNCPNGDCGKNGGPMKADMDGAPTLKSPMGPGI